MSHIGHKIVKCSGCGKIILQCRCMDLNKPVVYQVCGDCQLKGVKSQKPSFSMTTPTEMTKGSG